MDLDDDLPPELVEAEQGGDGEEKPKKVPITIVTGESSSKPQTLLCIGLKCSDRMIRVPRIRQDYTTELHIDGPTWQKDCRHHERVW
jgi:hypothetical protein